jgi:hypothetical protein
MKLMTQHNRPDERDKIIGIMVVFNKTRIKPQALDDLFHEYRSDNLQIIYGTGNFSFISTDSSEQ